MLKTSDLLPKTNEGDKQLFSKNTVDFIGCNYYQPLRVQAVSKEMKATIEGPQDLYQGYDWPENRLILIEGGKFIQRASTTSRCG